MATELAPIARPHALSEVVPSFEAINPDDVVSHFLDGRNPRTLRGYDSDLRDFARFVGQADPRKAIASLMAAGPGVANGLVLRYSAALEAKGLKAATIARRLAAIRSVMKLGRTLGQITWTIEIRSPKVKAYRDTRGPTLEEWKRLEAKARAEASTGDPLAVRNLAILTVMRNPALRRSELIGLDLADLELEGSEAKLWILGKGRTQKEHRTLAAGPTADLKAWLRIRGDHPGPVFHSLDRGAESRGKAARLTDRSIGNIVSELGRRARVERRVTPHGLRHNAITTVLNRTGGNIRMAQRFSRHADPRTLMIYDDAREDLAGECSRLLEE